MNTTNLIYNGNFTRDQLTHLLSYVRKHLFGYAVFVRMTLNEDRYDDDYFENMFKTILFSRKDLTRDDINLLCYFIDPGAEVYYNTNFEEQQNVN